MADLITSEKDLMELDESSSYFIFEKEGDYTSDVLYFKDPDALIMFLLEEIQHYGTKEATLRTSTHLYEVKKKQNGKHLH
tara:strand:+ start:71 stop:310 length:240 start_codon:yes stop_codon:yes gene_type:complete